MSNDRLKSILHDIHSLTLVKLEKFRADDNPDVTALDTLETRVKTAFDQFTRPEQWVNVIAFNEDEVLELFLALEDVEPPDLDKFQDEVGNCITFVEMLFADATPIDGAATKGGTQNPWNLKALEALRNIQFKIVGRINFFRGQGIDVVQDPAYQDIRAELDPAWDAYRTGLENDTLTADNTDVILLNKFAEAIAASTAVPAFYELLRKLTRYLEKRTQTA
ncbi:MAG: hypothetical protein KDC54_10340 [Lewinella sp.]|nr:hypothetical protein [Lewinella sp.]